MIDATRSALCYSLCAEHQGAAQDARQTAAQTAALEFAPPYNDVVAFVAAQQGRMPDTLRRPILLLTLLFGLWGLLRTGRVFHRHGLPARAAQVAAWRASRLGVCRDLIRFYESLALLALYDRGQHAGGGAP